MMEIKPHTEGPEFPAEYRGWTVWRFTGWRSLKRIAEKPGECWKCGAVIEPGESMFSPANQTDVHWTCEYPDGRAATIFAQWLAVRERPGETARHCYANCGLLVVAELPGGQYEQGQKFEIIPEEVALTAASQEEARYQAKSRGYDRLKQVIDQLEGQRFKLKLKYQRDDTYVLAIEEDGKAHGIAVCIDLSRFNDHSRNPLAVVSDLINAVHVLQALAPVHFKQQDDKTFKFVEHVHPEDGQRDSEIHGAEPPVEPASPFQKRLMMGSRALGGDKGQFDISRDDPDYCLIHDEDVENWIGNWVTGMGFFDVRFPKATTRECTPNELEWMENNQNRLRIGHLEDL